MSRTLWIGLGHKARHGKDTVAEYLVGKYGGQYDIRCYAFGDNLKAEFYDAVSNPQHDYWKLAPAGSLRELPFACYFNPSKADKVAWCNEHKHLTAKHLQRYGTEFRRAQNDYYWTDALKAEIDKDAPQIAVIKDVRFPNEGVLVMSEGGYMVKCERQGFNDPSRDPNHISETALDNWPWSFVISVAEGQISELLQGADEVFSSILTDQVPVSEAA